MNACRLWLGLALLSTVLSVAHADEIPLTDSMIADKIEDELLLDPGVRSHRVDVSTSEGIVTLEGRVPSLLDKVRAKELASTIRGVRGIVDRLTVKPTAMDDEVLHGHVISALLEDPATDSYEVDLVVKSGHVKLSGEVDSFAERTLCERVVSGVKGVTAVENALTVNYAEERPDAEILQDVQQKLAWDALIDQGLIKVEVDQGTVTLTGAVGTLAEKRRADFAAHVAGVDSVVTEGLKLQDWAKDNKVRDPDYVVKSDDEIAKAIEDALLYDPRCLSFKIDVTVETGVATLRGKVSSLKAMRAADDTARNVLGVLDVKNRLRIRPEPTLDSKIARRVRDALSRDPYVADDLIKVRVDDGVVRMTGNVDTFFERAQADDLASRVGGVIMVDNDLVAAPDTWWIPATPFLDYGWHVSDYTWYFHPHLPLKSDKQLEKDVMNELWWSPFVDSEDIMVEVDSGVATLKGTVSSLREKRFARDNAYEAGAILVEDELELSVPERDSDE